LLETTVIQQEVAPSHPVPAGMERPVTVQPDMGFIRDVMASGGEDVKKCFQCATCSVACSLSTDEAPFPRRQMLQAQWGLKDQLVADPALWLCHNCGDCSTRCPREARPGDVLGALRREAIRHFAFPTFVGSLVADRKRWPLLFLLPAVIFALIGLTGPRGAGEHLEFANVFPILTLEALFFAVSGFALVAFGVGIARFVTALRASGATAPILAGLIPALLLIIAHRRFKECESEQKRYWGHLLTVGGFMGLAVMGTVVGMGTMFGVMHTPLAMTNPWKIFANVSALAIVAGIGLLLADRVGDPAKRASSTYFDWFFLLTLAGVVLTGMLSQFLRLGELASVMFGVYFVHLVLVFALFMYAPYSKFAHLAYRTVAMAATGAGSDVDRRRPRRRAA
jgi:quinone-modifying oxidoreductase, subunit QmoC